MSGTNVITPITIGTGASKTTKDPTTWAATQQASVDTTGLNIPGMTGMQTYAQLFQAIESDALHGSSGGKLWGRIRPILIAQAQNYTKKELATKGWLEKDTSGLRAFLTGLHNTNAISKTAPLTALSWIEQKANDVGTVGKTSFTAKPAPAPIVPVSATSDLTAAAQSAFATTLGRSASPQEAATFAKAFQDAQNNFGQAKNDARKQNVFNPPAQPINFAQSGQAPIKPPASASTDTTGIMAPPTPTVAAANFAARTNSTNASAQAAADGLGQFLGMLKGS